MLDDYLREVSKQRKLTPFEYRLQSQLKTQANLEKRERAWDTPECQAIYNSIIEAAGGMDNVRPGMRGRAKTLAINCYLKGKVPDIEAFILASDEANALHEYRQEIKQAKRAAKGRK